MNMLESYLIDIHEVRPSNEDWMKADGFKNQSFVEVEATWNCYGCIERRKEVFEENEWEQIKEKGYCFR